MSSSHAGRRRFLGVAALAALGAAGPRAAAAAQRSRCYEPGDRVDGGVFVLGADLEPLPLRSLLRDPVTALLIFGGANGRTPPGIWCHDSESDLRLHRSLLARFAARGLRYVAVAVPPVYREARYGFARGSFLAEADDAPSYREAASRFVAGTETLREQGAIGFATLYYDPRFRLLDNASQGPHTAAYGPVPAWQGRFKWREDEQSHGTPVLWLLSGDGTVLHEPFWGNVYAGEERRLRYAEADVAAAIEEILGKAQGGGSAGRDREGGR